MIDRFRWTIGLIVAQLAWCGLLLTGSPWRALAIFFGLIATVAIGVSPHLGIYVMATILIGQWPYNLTRNLGVVVAGSAVGWLIINRRRIFRPNSMLYLMVLYFILVVLSTLSPMTRVGLVSQLAMYAAQVVLIWLFVTFIDSKQRVLNIVRLMVFAGIATALIGLVQSRTHFVWVMGTTRYYLEADKEINEERTAMDLQGWRGHFRIDSITGTPDLLPIYMQSLAPFVALWTVRQRAWRRVTGIAIVCLFAIAHVLSFTRGAMLTTAVVVVLTGWVIDKRRLLLLGPSVAVAGMMLMMCWPAWRDRVVSMVAFRAEEAPGVVNTGDWRLRTVSVALQVMLEHPLLGVGIGQQQWNWPESTFGDLIPDPRYVEPIPIHNTYLGIGIDLGFGGLALYVGTILFVMWTLRRLADTFRQRGELALADVAVASNIAMVGIALAALFYPLAGTFRYYPLLIALTASMQRIVEQYPSARKTTDRPVPPETIDA